MKILRCLAGLLTMIGLANHCNAGTLVQFQIYFGANTYVGNIEVELYDQDKPVTVKNFLNYVNGGYYGNNFFNRCVPGSILQGGGLYTLTPASTNLFTSDNSVPTVFGEITNEFYSGTLRSNTYGTLAMARGTNFNSATSQFFFNLANNSSQLDSSTNYYAVFGQVLRGTNILNAFNTLSGNGDGIIDMTYFYGVSPATEALTELPVYYIGLEPPRYEDLIYMNITVLNLQAQLTNNAMRLSWNSINGLTNNVEYSTIMPPNWQVLTNPVGNGASMTVIDTNKTSGQKFYRIHVLY